MRENPVNILLPYRDLRVEEERRALDLLSNEKAQRCEHGDATVSDLDVGVTLRLRLVDVLEEAEEVDTFRKGGAALHESAFHRGADIGELLAKGHHSRGPSRRCPDGGALPEGGGHGDDAKAAYGVHDCEVEVEEEEFVELPFFFFGSSKLP